PWFMPMRRPGAAAAQERLKFKWVDDTLSGLRIGVPFALVKEVPESRSWNGHQWQSEDGQTLITTFKHPLSKYTINSYFRTMLGGRPNSRIAHIDLTSESFVIEGESVGPKGPYSYQVRAYQVGDHIVGMLAHYPPAVADDMERVVNANASRFQRNNGWRTIYLSNCGSKQPGEARIFYGTNRAQLTPATVAADGVDIDGLFAPIPAGQLHLGCAHVSVPTDIEARRALTPSPGLASANPTAHYILKRFRPITSSAVGDPGRRIVLVDDTYAEGGERALIFIHGYNVGFGDAVRRMAQIASDTGYKGKIYVFSWPSLGQRTRYTADLDTAEQSEAYLESFIRLILTDRNVQTLDVIAHSMGSQPFLRVVRGVARSFDQPNRRGRRIRFGQVIFAAPDVGAEVFKEKVREIVPLAKRVTLYASSTDCAMYASRLLRLGRGRAGDLENGKPLVIDGVETIDASDVRPSGLLERFSTVVNWGRLRNYFSCNHAYFADRQKLLDDLTALLRTDDAPPSRSSATMTRIGPSDSRSGYWRLPPE
ncbi:MAG TPA: alpha/beta hydrolase, partial [Hyphomicrobiaceae bacterium]|nr:alpha/beta hydrolase [Hyphomicrobiaceae bacterium]